MNFLVRLLTIPMLLAFAVPLTVFHLWGLGFAITPAAAGYMALASIVTWLGAFNFYYYALRSGAVGVVAPISSMDPLFTALFAVVILGTTLGGPTLAGLLLAMAGVVLISRWMEGSPEPLPEIIEAPARTGGDDAASAPRGKVFVIGLSIATAAAWGLGPVLIDLANDANRVNGGACVTMMLESEALGALLLGAVMLWRRMPIWTRRLERSELRRAVVLLLVTACFEAVFGLGFYVIIDRIGPVLTMLIIATSPIFSITGGVIFLRERFSVRLGFAAALTLAGVVLAVLDGAV
jgi:drug/metabolite transporter (DMT)-like permease